MHHSDIKIIRFNNEKDLKEFSSAPNVLKNSIKRMLTTLGDNGEPIQLKTNPGSPKKIFTTDCTLVEVTPEINCINLSATAYTN